VAAEVPAAYRGQPPAADGAGQVDADPARGQQEGQGEGGLVVCGVDEEDEGEGAGDPGGEGDHDAPPMDAQKGQMPEPGQP
jgi:hypothetical protein